jgi:hypothetical protein
MLSMSSCSLSMLLSWNLFGVPSRVSAARRLSVLQLLQAKQSACKTCRIVNYR